jgi:KUP system potassium uptake protein
LAKAKIRYPSEEKGQLFIPSLNFLIFVGCVGVVLYFRTASRMEAAYGLAIIVTMIMTTILFSNYMIARRIKSVLIWLFLGFYIVLEIFFLWALLHKFGQGGYITMLIGGLMLLVMYVWYRARKIKNRYVEFVRLEHYIPKIQELSNDRSVPKYATHLVYLTSADNPKEIRAQDHLFYTKQKAETCGHLLVCACRYPG